LTGLGWTPWAEEGNGSMQHMDDLTKKAIVDAANGATDDELKKTIQPLFDYVGSYYSDNVIQTIKNVAKSLSPTETPQPAQQSGDIESAYKEFLEKQEWQPWGSVGASGYLDDAFKNAISLAANGASDEEISNALDEYWKNYGSYNKSLYIQDIKDVASTITSTEPNQGINRSRIPIIILHPMLNRKLIKQWISSIKCFIQAQNHGYRDMRKPIKMLW
jgi:hypothetical protein